MSAAAPGRSAEAGSRTVPDQIAALTSLPLDQLRSEWQRLHRAVPPVRLSRDLLRRGIAHTLQEGVHAIAIAPEADKTTRLQAQSMHIEDGRVLLPAEAPWMADWQTELLRFPQSQHDDQVDSLSQFLAWATDRASSGPRLRKL